MAEYPRSSIMEMDCDLYLHASNRKKHESIVNIVHKVYVLKPYDNVFWETVQHYCNIQKFGIGKSIFMFLKEVSCAHPKLHLFDQKCIKK